MIRIEPQHWLPATYARSLTLSDILRHPTDGYHALGAVEQNKLRQSQIEAGEIVRVLGFHEDHALIMKFDQVLGWVLQNTLAQDEQLSDFVIPPSARMNAQDFLKHWHSTPYVWGGITRNGIDCSGLTQRYYRDVLDRFIPKNTYDQRRFGQPIPLQQISNHDLVFCTRVGGSGIHHVGVYLEHDIWHAHGELGVIRQDFSEFTDLYQVLEVIRLI